MPIKPQERAAGAIRPLRFLTLASFPDRSGKGHKSLNLAHWPSHLKNPENPPLTREGHTVAKTSHGLNFVTFRRRDKSARHRESV